MPRPTSVSDAEAEVDEETQTEHVLSPPAQLAGCQYCGEAFIEPAERPYDYCPRCSYQIRPDRGDSVMGGIV